MTQPLLTKLASAVQSLHVLVRFWSKVAVVPGGCWNWTAATNGIYGTFSVQGTHSMIGAHQFSYYLANGKLTDGLTVEHICRNTRCVNPVHLEELPLSENIARGFGAWRKKALATHCQHGHPYEPPHLYITPSGHRRCMSCVRLRRRGNV